MKKYRLKSIQEQAGILHVTLVPKHRRDQLRFYPGQYAAIGFKSDNGRRSPMRCFSITSSPARPDELQFAIRLGGAFTSTLSGLEAGTDMYVQGPFGSFVVNEKRSRQIVLLAGGIGITPFMSMIRTLSYRKSELPVTLMYSYRNGHQIPFQAELQRLQAINPRLRIATFVTNSATAPNLPRLFSGRMNEQHIRQVVEGQYRGSTYYVCGPKGFIESTVAMLQDHGISDNRILTESFTQSAKVLTSGGRSIQRLTYAFATAVLVIGIAGISYLDLSRYVPRYIQTADKTQTKLVITPKSSTPTSTSTPASTSTNNVTTPSSSSPSSSESNNSTSTQSSNASSNNSSQSYQQPVTSVS